MSKTLYCIEMSKVRYMSARGLEFSERDKHTMVKFLYYTLGAKIRI